MKANPSALALAASLGARMIAEVEAQKERVLDAPPLDRRDARVPAGFKRVYAPNQPHQGKKEMARRRRQMEWAGVVP